MKNEEILRRNSVIAEYMGYINLRIERPELIQIDLWQTGVYTEKDSHKLGGFRSPLDKNYCVIKDLLYHESWNQLIPVFEKFCNDIETVLNKSRLNISFCSSFMYGVSNNDIEESVIALVEGIYWLVQLRTTNEKIAKIQQDGTGKN